MNKKTIINKGGVCLLFFLCFVLFARVDISYSLPTTFTNFDQFATELLTLKYHLDTELNDQGLSAVIYNLPLPDDWRWDSFFSMGGSVPSDLEVRNIMFGFGWYFKDFSLPLTIRVYEQDSTSPSNNQLVESYTVNPDSNGEPVFFGLISDPPLSHFAIGTSTDPATGVKEWASYSSPFPWGLLRSIPPETDSSPIPEPTSILLVGSGLVGLAGFRKKFKK